MIQADNNEEAKRKWIDNLMGRLTLEQKVGQLMVFGFAGPILTPHVKELITKYHVGGFRIAQKFHGGTAEGRSSKAKAYAKPNINTYDRYGDINNKRIACTPSEYAETLNAARDLALNRKDGIGLHFVYDQEGEGTDFLFNERLFPYPMGLAASGDPGLAYRVALAAGRQARALGANMIHSPVLDVNTNPKNPEIGPRSYSDKTEVVTRYALETLRGFSDAGIVCTGKHFPGRGESESDAHFGLPVVNMDRESFMKIHVAPYKALIDAGLPAIMAAFTAYPAFSNGEEVPGATSREIITDLLRGELGFKGVVTTDNMQMQGLLSKYPLGEAAIRCLNAGCDLLLFRSESPATIYLINEVIAAVKDGRYPEKQLDESVQRILAMRWDMGLAENGGKVDPSKADIFNDEFIKGTAVEAAEKSIVMLRNQNNVLPLPKDKKILLVEQAHHFHSFINNTYSHPGMLWYEMRKYSDNVGVVLINESYTEQDKEAVKRRISEGDFDIIVATSYYNYRTHAMMLPLLKELKQFNLPIVVVANTPYENFGVPADVEGAIVSFCPSGRENIEAAAKVLFGELKPTAKLDVKLK